MCEYFSAKKHILRILVTDMWVVEDAVKLKGILLASDALGTIPTFPGAH